MTNGLLTAEVLLFCQIITQSHLDAISPGAFQNTKSAVLQETEFKGWIIFFLPSPPSLEQLNDNVMKRNSKACIC